jgi:4-amino-4-deoxy-L-arabinose transferase-like glycosyltransferase
MMESGNFVVPTFNARLRVDKPILLYWLLVASFQTCGINEFAVRLPSTLAALGTLVCCYELGRALFRPSTALLGGLILGSTAMMAGAARFANPDALLSFFIVLTLTLFWRGHGRPRSSWFMSMGIVLGFGALAKGPVGVALPALVIVVYLAWERRLAVLCDRRLLYGALALALAALPWYICVTVLTHGSFLQGFLWEHNVSRFLNPINNHNGSPLYYFVVLFVGLAPWTLFIFFACWYGIWSRPESADRGRQSEAGSQRSEATGQQFRPPTDSQPMTPDLHCAVSAHRFLGVWLISYLLFFSLAATKLPNYLLPAAVPCALLIARFLDRWRLGEVQPPRWVLHACLVSMAGIGIATSLGLALVSGRVSFEPLITRLPAGSLVADIDYWVLIGLVPVAAALVGAWYLRRQARHGVVLSLIAGTVLFLAPSLAWVPTAWNMIKAPRPLTEQAGTSMPDALRPSQDIRVGGFHLEHLPSLNFYTRRVVMHQDNEAEALAFLRYQVPVFLYLPAHIWSGLRDKAPPSCRLIACHPDLYRCNDVVVVTNGVGR